MHEDKWNNGFHEFKNNTTIFTIQHVLLAYIYNFDYLHYKIPIVFL